MKKRTVEDTSLFFEVLNNTPQESKNYVSKSLEIVHEIILLLREKDMNQKKLAQKLGKTEAEISKWLSGTHNFTIRTLTSIETAINEEIIVTPHKVRSNALKYTTAIYRASVNEIKSCLHNAEKYNIKSKSERLERSAA
ncbi:MAG: helix-turn-helix domain-containing protein [Cyclobacteriaceae bacterium]|nr:helix-turn-helix domain-containing protein [Cyclobacteriaceae bacterium]